MNRPCPVTIDCPGVDSPIQNFSSEAADQIVFVGTGYPNFDPYSPPPLGNGQYIARDCQGNAFSVLSQQIADLIAQIEAENCQQGGGGLQYSNSPQSVTLTCNGGELFTYTVEAGSVVSPIFPILDPNASTPQQIADQQAAIGAWIEAANERAKAYALQQASAQLCCLSVNNDDACVTVPIPAGGFLFTAHSNTTDTYTMSVASGSLPPGLTFVQTGNLTAELHGTPTHVGIYTFTVEVRSVSAFTSKTFTVNILNCSGAPLPCGPSNIILPDATEGAPYIQQIPSSGGPGPFTYITDPIMLPSWIDSISPSGIITSIGGPDHSDVGIDFSFDVLINGSNGSSCNVTVHIEVDAAAVLGYFLCGWPNIEKAFHASAPTGDADHRTGWSGLLDKNNQTSLAEPFYYFTGQSLFGTTYGGGAGKAISADQDPLYPAGNWQDNLTYTKLQWSTGAGMWLLLIETSGLTGETVWLGGGSTDINDPEGRYDWLSGSSEVPLYIYVSAVTNISNPSQNCITTCADWPDTTKIDWFANPGTCRLRILPAQYPVTYHWPQNDYIFAVPSIQPFWDGKYPSFAPGSTFGYYTTAGVGVSGWMTTGGGDVHFDFVAKLFYNYGQLPGVATDTWWLVLDGRTKAMWAGSLAGKNPIGTYNRDITYLQFDSVPPGLMPAFFTIEAYTPP